MQYITEVQFELLRKALWTSAINSVKSYDASFWRDVIRNGFDEYLQRVHDYPQTCHESTTFTTDAEDDSSESSTDSAVDTVEHVSDVLLGRCVLATSACRELEYLLDTETIPSMIVFVLLRG
eukprot:5993618-Amphidinium_carterae.1